jgi:adenylate cyclase
VIDDISLETLSEQVGGWPWPRGLIVADLITNYIMAGNPSVLLFDVIYSTLSPKMPDEPISDEDLWMAEISEVYPNLSHAVLFTDEAWDAQRDVNPHIREIFEIPVDDSTSRITLPEYNFFLAPYEPLASMVNMLHSVNHTEDADGISRGNQVLLQYEGHYYPGLTTRGIMEHAGIDNFRIDGRTFVMERDGEEAFTAPLQPDGGYRLNFYASADAFTAYPADNVIASAQDFFSGIEDVAVPLDAFEGKIVMIGASALGLKDIKVTPMGTNFAGPYLHMTAMSNILEGHHLRFVEPIWAGIIAVALTLFILVVVLFVPSGVIRATVGGLPIILWLAGGLLAFRYLGVAVEMATTLSSTALAYVGGLAFTSFNESVEKRKISNAMGKYLAPAVMNEVLENYDELIGEVGEERELTILFSDIRSFSSISENYSAAQVVEVLNRYLERMLSVVFENRGTVDKIIGDAIMAFWGAPNPEQDKESLAVDTAIRMVRFLDVLNAELEADSLPTVRIGVGLHTGGMIVGNIGSSQRLDYTAIGDNVNLGSRLEGLTKYYRCPILVSEPTYAPLKDAYTFLYADSVAVKGKTKGIGIYAPIDPLSLEADPGLSGDLEAFRAAREHYADRDFVGGARMFGEIVERNSVISGLAELFQKRCVQFENTPPPENWTGVWKMTEK